MAKSSSTNAVWVISKPQWYAKIALEGLPNRICLDVELDKSDAIGEFRGPNYELVNPVTFLGALGTLVDNGLLR